MAQRVVGETLQAQQAKVQTWLQGQTPRLTLTQPFNYEVGKVIPQGALVSQPSNNAFVLLVRDPLGPNGYSVHTSFPKP